MYPYRDFYRNASTIRSLPIAIKTSSDNSWVSVLSTEISENRDDAQYDPPKELNNETIINCLPYEPPEKSRYTCLKDLCLSLKDIHKFAIIFHFSNIIQFMMIPYLLVFWYKEPWSFYLAYYLAIINDLIYIIYTTIQCRRQKRCCEWVYNIFLVFPFWCVYEELENRTSNKPLLMFDGDYDGFNLGFFICRCFTCPLRLYWSIRLLKIIGIGEFSFLKLILRLLLIFILVIHGSTVLWSLTVIACKPRFLDHFVANASQSFMPTYSETVHFATGIMFGSAHSGPIEPLPNVYIILVSIMQFLFILYWLGFLFLYLELHNKRIVKLQHFTTTLKKYMHNQKLVQLIPKVVQNHENVKVHKRSVALDECRSMLKNVNWSLVQDVLFDLNLPALKAGTILGVKHPSIDCYLRYLSTKMRREFYNAGENLLEAGAPLEKMIVLVQGHLDVLAEDNKTSMLSLEPGTCLGQSSLLIFMVCKATVKCVTHVKVVVLTRRDFLLSTLTAFPDVYQQIFRLFQGQINDAKIRNKTMLMRPPQHDVNIAERANSQLYKVCNINPLATRQGTISHIKASKIGKVDQDLTLNAIWNFLMVAISIIVAIWYPYFVAFERTFPNKFKILAIPMEVLIVVDLMLTLLTYEIPKGKQRVFSWNGRAFISHLCKKLNDWSFYLDFFAGLFLETIIYILPSTYTEEEKNFLFYFLKLNRVLKIYKLFHFVWAINCSNEFQKRLFFYSIIICFIIYYGAVLLFLTTCFHPTCSPRGWYRLLRAYEIQMKIKPLRTDSPFWCSLHASLVQIHRLDIHLTHDSWDLIISNFLTLLGLAYYSVILLDIANLLFLQLQQDILYKRYQRDMVTFCASRKLPHNLKQRLLNYYKLQWYHDPGYFYRQNHGSYMSTTLAEEVILAERYDTLRKVPLLNSIGPQFCKFLALKSKVYLVPSGDIITYLGNMNKEMLVLVQGYCEDEQGRVVVPLHTSPQMRNISMQTIRESHYPREQISTGTFGMQSLLFNLPENHTIRTITSCLFISIDGSALQKALLYYPNQNALLSLILRSVQYMEASRIVLKVPDNHPIEAKEPKGLMVKIREFFSRVSFINVIKYCAQRGETYGYPFQSEEISFMRFFMLPLAIHPFGVFFLSWAVLRAAVALILGITAPLMLLSYTYHHQELNFLFIMDVFCDSVLLLDCFLLCYLAYVNNDGILVVHPYKTLLNFGGCGMLIDFALAMPIEWIYYAQVDDPKTFALLRLIKVVQMYKYFVILVKIKGLDMTGLTKAIEIIRCISWIVFLANSSACTLIAIECQPLGNGTLYCPKNSWMQKSAVWNKEYMDLSEDGNHAPVGQLYLLALHWTICILFGVSFGHFQTQGGYNLLIVVIILTLGIFLQGHNMISIVSYFVALLKQRKSITRVLDYQKMTQQLMNFLDNEEIVDKATKDKYKNNAIYHWRMTHGSDTTLLLSKLHTTLLQDTLCYLYEDTLRQVPLFRNMDRAFLRILVLIAKPIYLMPNQVIIQQEEICDQFYIVLEGMIHIELARSSYNVNISTGSIFGHFSKETTPLMSIVASTQDFVHVLCVKSIDYFNILKNYAKFDLVLKNVLSEYKDFMPNHSHDEEGLQYLVNDKANLPRKKTRFYQQVVFYKELDIILNVFALIDLFLIPLNLLSSHWAICYSLLIVDIVFVIAFIFEFNQPYYNHMGCLVTDFHLTKKYNMSGKRRYYLYLALVCNIILMILHCWYFFPLITSNWAQHRISWEYVRLVALYRIRYIGKRAFKDIDDDFWVTNLLNTVMILLLVLHWTACIWVLIETYNDVALRVPTNIILKYFEALLLMTNLLTSGTTIRRIFRYQWEQVCVSVLLILFHMYRLCLVAKTIVWLYLKMKTTLSFNFQLKQLQAYLKTMQINPYQIKNVKKHLIGLEKQEMGTKFPTLLAHLPTPLMKELKILLYRSLVEQSYVFYGTQTNFIRNITVHLKRSVYFEGEIILQRGDIDKCMYFIRKGNVAIITIKENHTEVQHEVLQAGEMFGLVQGLFRHNFPHQFTYKANTNAEILTLRLEHWEHLLRHFPRSREIIYNRIRNIQQ